jgi:hypothetical protein
MFTYPPNMDQVLVAIDVPQLGDGRRRHWAKLVTEVDTTKSTGWAYVGEFVSDGGIQDLPAGGLLLLYGERGSSQNPQPEAALYRVGSDSSLTLEGRANGRAWARTLRDLASELLEARLVSEPDLSGIQSVHLVEELVRRGFRVEAPE